MEQVCTENHSNIGRYNHSPKLFVIDHRTRINVHMNLTASVKVLANWVGTKFKYVQRLKVANLKE